MQVQLLHYHTRTVVSVGLPVVKSIWDIGPTVGEAVNVGLAENVAVIVGDGLLVGLKVKV